MAPCSRAGHIYYPIDVLGNDASKNRGDVIYNWAIGIFQGRAKSSSDLFSANYIQSDMIILTRIMW
jgi:hypothetical protein